MEKYLKIYLGFSLIEMLVVLVVIGTILAIVMNALNFSNKTDEGRLTKSIQMSEILYSTLNQMITEHSYSQELTALMDKEGTFSIENPSDQQRFIKMYKSYLSTIDLAVDTSDSYFKKNILDYNNNSTGIKVNSYSNFFHGADGILVGFKFYNSCTASENISNPPRIKQYFTSSNICASIFYDVNSLAKPNKLGTDQFIIPIEKIGLKYGT